MAKICYCHEYKFPHRASGGACVQPPFENTNFSEYKSYAHREAGEYGLDVSIIHTMGRDKEI